MSNQEWATLVSLITSHASPRESAAWSALMAERDKLLAVLKFVNNQLELLAPPGSDERKLSFGAISEARAAIAKAEGRAQ